MKLQDLSQKIKMSLPDIQLHLSRSFCWHAGLGYSTRSSPQMKTNNMNLTLLTTNSNFGDEAVGCGGGVNYYSLRFSHTCKPFHALLTHVNLPTQTCWLQNHARIQEFFQGSGSMPDGQKWTTCFFFVLNLFYSL